MDILIEGFPYFASTHEIKKLFRRYGSVKKVKKDGARTYAIVNMPYLEQAERAIEDLNGSRFFDREIIVRKK